MVVSLFEGGLGGIWGGHMGKNHYGYALGTLTLQASARTCKWFGVAFYAGNHREVRTTNVHSYTTREP